MFILVFNSGSSSLKFKLYSLADMSLAAHGSLTNYSPDNYSLELKSDQANLQKPLTAPEYAVGPKLILDWLLDNKIIQTMEDIRLIAHRVVHGGTHYAKATRLTDQVVADLRDLSDLAPLHNPASLKVIDFLHREFPKIPQAACFDTAFHSSLLPSAYTYPIPLQLQQSNIRKYGFHGLSVAYANQHLQRQIQNPAAKTIICHLGSGCSITAVQFGKSLEHSMGFSPLSGLIMSTRSGDLDPGLVLYLLKRYKLTPEEMEDHLNKRSGLLALSGFSPNLYDVLSKEAESEQAALAVDIYVRRIVQTIGGMYALMGGVDELLFTGTIGLKSNLMRQKICTRLGFLGVMLDQAKNASVDEFFESPQLQLLSLPSSRVRVWALLADEEQQIAKECLPLLHQL